MTGRDLDQVSLVAGLSLLGLGLLLVADQAGVFDLSVNLLGAGVSLTLGMILLISGLKDGQP
jgi:hypothetical protein